ncbi:MAG: G5 domain-containing protein [Anaerolineae bacterium]
MRYVRWIVWACLLLLLACQPQSPGSYSIVDGGLLRIVVTSQRAPEMILTQAGLSLVTGDQLLFNGEAADPAAPLSQSEGTLQIRRTVSISINGKEHRTAARTVGAALAERGMELRQADSAAPGNGVFITGPLVVQYAPAREVLIRADGKDYRTLSAAGTVGQALAEAGLPLIGLDFSKPAENEPPPMEGPIQVVRVTESIILAEKSIPFQSEYKQSTEVEVGTEQILQPGVEGLSVSRIRIRYEDGQEVSRQTEAETVVRPPQNRIAARGTKVVIKTTTVNGVTIQYWRELQMYATVYSPCTSGGANGCSSGTASGRRAGKGVVAVDPGLYAYLNGQQLYIPGYGHAVIGDIGGGYIVEQNLGVSRYRWIDLGFDDNNITDMSGWITVYFLAPAPASIPDVLQ